MSLEAQPLAMNFTWIVGGRDQTTLNPLGWKVLDLDLSLSGPADVFSSQEHFTGEVHQRIVFPGDHFFIFDSPLVDERIADECFNSAIRFL